MPQACCMIRKIADDKRMTRKSRTIKIMREKFMLKFMLKFMRD